MPKKITQAGRITAVCGTCDAVYDPSDHAEALVHTHPEPQSGPPREAWISSGLPYTRWIAETKEGFEWAQFKGKVVDCTHLSYEEIKAVIDSLPITWMPALFIHFCDVVASQPVFNPGKMSERAAEAERKHGKAKP